MKWLLVIIIFVFLFIPVWEDERHILFPIRPYSEKFSG